MEPLCCRCWANLCLNTFNLIVESWLWINRKGMENEAVDPFKQFCSFKNPGKKKSCARVWLDSFNSGDRFNNGRKVQRTNLPFHPLTICCVLAIYYSNIIDVDPREMLLGLAPVKVKFHSFDAIAYSASRPVGGARSSRGPCLIKSKRIRWLRLVFATEPRMNGAMTNKTDEISDESKCGTMTAFRC
jgi:hypothetical protein